MHDVQPTLAAQLADLETLSRRLRSMSLRLQREGYGANGASTERTIWNRIERGNQLTLRISERADFTESPETLAAFDRFWSAERVALESV